MERLSTRFELPGTLPVLDPVTRKELGPLWQVTVYDNDTNTYEEVITVLMIATACTAEEAYIEAWEIDKYGQCVVHRADESECQGVADVVGTIGIKVEVSQEA